MSALFRLRYDASTQSIWTIPAVFFIAAVLACLTTPSQHSLLVNTISWSVLCTVCSFRTGLRALLEVKPGKAIAYGAGILLAIAQICERAVGSQNLWWTQALLPSALYAVYHFAILPGEDEGRIRVNVSWSGLSILSLCALITSYRSTGSYTVIALGLTYLILLVLILLALERALKETASKNIIYPTNSLLSQPTSVGCDSVIVVLRDVSLAAGMVCLVTAIAWESWRFDGLTQWGLLGRILGDSWIPGQSILSFLQAVVAVVVQILFLGALVFMVHREKPLTTSLILTGAFSFASLLSSFTLSSAWFFSLTGALLASFHEDHSKVRPVRIITLCVVVSIVILLVQHLRSDTQVGSIGSARFAAPQPLAPVQLTDKSVHPIAQLIRAAKTEWAHTFSRQSRTLDAAVKEYRHRYGMAPPPNFDKWFEYAKTRNVQLIDEYHTIYNSLLPFWALSPATIRARARDALGYKENNLVGLLIRDGKAVHVAGGDDWQQRATVGLMEQFVQHLPDMDLAFNIHDEPRVVLPSAGLQELVLAGLSAIAAVNTKPRNLFSERPKDISEGRRIEEVKTTVFNHIAHQRTWGISKISCPATTPVGTLREAADNLTSYALEDLGFVYNQTAFSDICNSPSFEGSHGFFERANAFNVVHDLYPIFSQSKMSSFQDIVYPSPWYWYNKVSYHELQDEEWAQKQNKMWWRGSTTGGFSRDGGWRHQHRQLLVKKLNAPDQAKILARGSWTPTDVARQDYKDIIDVHFSSIGQCDDNDCAAQEEFFTVVPKADQQEAWKYKYLLDMDGNAFSGRFYAFLRSRSLTLKMAVFKEWHEEWIKPWVHYVPLSLRGEEILEAVRYFDTEQEGQEEAIHMAEVSSDWAKAALRQEDFEAWFFRLLLEYGRLVDDNRDSIGFA